MITREQLEQHELVSFTSYHRDDKDRVVYFVGVLRVMHDYELPELLDRHFIFAYESADHYVFKLRLDEFAAFYEALDALVVSRSAAKL